MKPRALRLALGLALISTAATLAQVPPPSKEGLVRVVSYFDADPAQIASAITKAHLYEAESRREPGVIDLRLLQEIGRPDRFVILEAWHDQAAYDAHLKAASAQAWLKALAPVAISPPDTRVHRAFLGTPPTKPLPRGTVFVLTHVDVSAPNFPPLLPPLRAYVSAMATQPGVLSFEALQHVEPRQNHLTVVGAWTNRAAFEAAERSAAWRQYRATISPLQGALYDERLYREID
jgi:quinol monooxygenase YgiN